MTELKATMVKRIEAFCQDELPADFTFPKGKPEARIAVGNVEEEILYVADHINADLIVMGTRTHSNLTKLFLGSSAQKVLQRSKRPVLIAPLDPN